VLVKRDSDSKLLLFQDDGIHYNLQEAIRSEPLRYDGQYASWPSLPLTNVPWVASGSVMPGDMKIWQLLPFEKDRLSRAAWEAKEAAAKAAAAAAPAKEATTAETSIGTQECIDTDSDSMEAAGDDTMRQSNESDNNNSDINNNSESDTNPAKRKLNIRNEYIKHTGEMVATIAANICD
jgi:hypothetical protein